MQDRDDPEPRLTARALAKRWQVAHDDRPKLVAMLTSMAMDPTTKPRQRITAVKTLVMCEALDLKSVEVGIKAEEHEDLKARIEAVEARAETLASRVDDHRSRYQYLPPRSAPTRYLDGHESKPEQPALPCRVELSRDD